jgi:hypothetical protein
MCGVEYAAVGRLLQRCCWSCGVWPRGCKQAGIKPAGKQHVDGAGLAERLEQSYRGFRPCRRLRRYFARFHQTVQLEKRASRSRLVLKVNVCGVLEYMACFVIPPRPVRKRSMSQRKRMLIRSRTEKVKATIRRGEHGPTIHKAADDGRCSSQVRVFVDRKDILQGVQKSWL